MVLHKSAEAQNLHKSTHSMFRPISIFAAVVLTSGACSAATFNFDGSSQGFTDSFNTPPFDGPWVYGATAGAGGTGGWSTDGQNADTGTPMTTDLTSPSLFVTTTGAVSLSFNHRFSFEDDGTKWDGGAVFLSVNGGAFTVVPTANFSLNPYNGSVAVDSASQMAGSSAFIGISAGYSFGTFITSTASLGSFTAGDQLMVRFRSAGDTNTTGGIPAWALDNVSISATAVPEPAIASLLAGGVLMMARRRRQD
jgi:hypothetical protein